MSSTVTSNAPQIDVQWILQNLVDQKDFQPVPHPTQNPEAWKVLADTTGKAYVDWADANLDYQWPQVLATQLLAYGRVTSRVAMEKPYFERRMSLQYFVMAECMTQQGKYLDKIIDGIWTICEETYWCLPPHMGASKENLLPDIDEPVLDLFASYTGQQLAWTVWLLGDKLNAVSPEIVRQIRRKVRFFVLDSILNHPRHWLGLDPNHIMNNWTPWICSTWLSTIWIFEDDPNKFTKAMGMLTNALNIFMSQQPEDGGCDEGVMYWHQAGAALFDCLDQLGGMTGTGKALFMDHPLLHNLARYPQVMHVADHDYVCFADGRAYSKFLSGYWISHWADALNDASMRSFGDHMTRQSVNDIGGHLCNFYRQIQRPFIDARVLARPHEPVTADCDVYLPDIQVMTARSSQQAGQGWHVSAKGGHNAESHNHNDIGQVVIYRDGHPLLIDVGVETYSGKTFSDRRYEIFTMQSQWHNLPTFGDPALMSPNHVPDHPGGQLPGRPYAAKSLTHQVVGGVTTFSLDISDAYAPAASVNRYQRTIVLDRDADTVVLSDIIELGKPQAMTMSLITTCEVKIAGDSLRFESTNLPFGRESANALVTWEGLTFDQIRVEERQVTDAIMQESWGTTLRRVLLTVNRVQAGDVRFVIKPTV